MLVNNYEKGMTHMTVKWQMEDQFPDAGDQLHDEDVLETFGKIKQIL